MATFYIGNSSGNGDVNAGTGVIAVPFVVEWFDQGNFGFAPPHNAKIQAHFVLGGTLRVVRRAVDSPVISVPVTVTSARALGAFRTVAKITDRTVTSPVFLTGKFALSIFLRESIVFAVFLGGDLPLQTYGALTREFFNDLTGIRQSFPWIIYRKGLTHYSQIKIGTTYQQPVNKPFLMSASIDVSQDPFLSSLGGQPNWIGMVLEQEVNGSPVQVVRFRAPEPFEVIVVAPQEAGGPIEILRWDGRAWTPYSTLPERAMDGQQVLQLFDREGVYQYYAQILGLMLAQWQYDTAHLRALIDPLTCPAPLVSLLANNFGLDILNETPEDAKREFIRQFVRLQKTKGVDESVREALRVLGYTGYAMHVWVIPGGGPSDYIERPLGYDVLPPGAYFPASQVAIHMNDLDGEPLVAIDDGQRADVADFLMRYILPAHIRIRYFATDIPVTTTDEAVTVSDALVILDI